MKGIASMKCEDGSTSRIFNLLLGNPDNASTALTFLRLWFVGVLLSPAVELVFLFVSPKAHPFWQVVGGAMEMFFFGILGAGAGMKLALIFAVLIRGIFRCSEGRGWDIAFFFAFGLSHWLGFHLLSNR